MQIKNVKVAFLEESIIRSGYPMQIGEPEEINRYVADLKYWINHESINDIIKVLEFNPTKTKWTNSDWSKYNQNEFKLSEENNCCIVVIRDAFGEPIREILIDYNSILKLATYKMSKSHDYIMLSKKGDEFDGFSLHRFLLNAKKGEVVDHINRNKDDYRLSNLRKTNHSGNNRNRSSVDLDNVLGVFYRNDRDKFFSRLTLNKKILSLGTFNTFKEAVIARLNGEIKYYKEYSPQLHLCEKYNIENPYKSTNEIELVPNLAYAYKCIKRITNLGTSRPGSGHDCVLKGIHVSFDLQYPEYFSSQLQRYHWIDIVSSQSKMHKIMSKHLTVDDFALPISKYIIDNLNYYIDDGNFRELINELPSGYLKWMGISTNYLQLKTIYSQRRTHKLNDWQEFCNWVETLPMSELIINKKK